MAGERGFGDMTLFEYLAIAFGLLYSVAALRVLGGLPVAIAPGRRYSLHLTLTFVQLMLIAISFWTFWSLREVAWTFRGFLFALLVPGLLYYCAAVLVPENPESVTSWRDHYYQVRRRWYGGFALWGVAAAVSATVNLGMPLDHPARGVHVVSVVLGLVGCLSAKPRVHAVIVLTLAGLLIAGAFSSTIDAGWLARP
jgi:hypothetical protein